MAYIYYCKKCKEILTFWNNDSGDFHRCPQCTSNAVSLNLTEEEWAQKSKEDKEEIIRNVTVKNTGDKDKDSSGNSTTSSEKANSIGTALCYAGWIYIFLSIIGAVVIMADSGTLGFVAGLFGCLGGLLLLGFGEIINLLQDIKNKPKL